MGGGQRAGTQVDRCGIRHAGQRRARRKAEIAERLRGGQPLAGQRVGQKVERRFAQRALQKRRAEAAPRNAQVAGFFARGRLRVQAAHKVHIARKEHKPRAGMAFFLLPQPAANPASSGPSRPKPTRAAGSPAFWAVLHKRPQRALFRVLRRRIISRGGGRRDQQAADARQRRAEGVGRRSLPTNSTCRGLRPVFCRNSRNSRPLRFCHAVFRRDEDAVEEIEAQRAQHGRDLRFRQVHVGHDIDGQAARFARARRGQQAGVGMHGPQLGRALGGRVGPLQRGLRVNFGERYFRMRAAGGGLGVQAALRKAGRGFARALH